MASHTGHRQRVKTEFLTRGIEGWPDHRVLELLLFFAIPQGDVNPLAHELIDRFGSLSKVLDASPDELKKVPGLGEHSVALLRMIPAISGRYMAQRSGPGTLVHTTQEAASLLAPIFTVPATRWSMCCVWTARERPWVCGRSLRAMWITPM